MWVVGDAEKYISFTIAPGETEVFDVTVDDNGRSFETTAWGGAPAWEEAARHYPPFYDWNWSDKWTVLRDGDIVGEYGSARNPLPLLPTTGQLPG